MEEVPVAVTPEPYPEHMPAEQPAPEESQVPLVAAQDAQGPQLVPAAELPEEQPQFEAPGPTEPAPEHQADQIQADQIQADQPLGELVPGRGPAGADHPAPRADPSRVP